MNAPAPLRVFLLLAGLLLGAAPAGADAPATAPTETATLAAFVEQGARPAAGRLVATAGRLDCAVRALCAAPSPRTLAEAQEAWREACLAWLRFGPYLFGPGARLERGLGRWNVNAVVLDAAVEAPDLKDLLAKPEQRGYAALEYLLFAPKDAAAATSPGRKAHLLDLAAEIGDATRRLAAEWDGDYAARFRAAGDGRPFLVPADALSTAFVRLLNLVETMLRDRIGIPSGFFKAPSRPDDLEAWRSRTTRAALLATIQGIRGATTAGGGAGMLALVAGKDGLVERRNPGLARAIVAQLDRTERALARLDDDLAAAVRRNPATLQPLYEELQKLQQQLVEASLVLELDVYGGTGQMAGATN